MRNATIIALLLVGMLMPRAWADDADDAYQRQQQAAAAQAAQARTRGTMSNASDR